MNAYLVSSGADIPFWDFGFIFAAIFGFLYAPLVITGLHHMTNAIDLQLIGNLGGTYLWPIIAISNIAQGSAVLAMIYLNRKDKKKNKCLYQRVFHVI